MCFLIQNELKMDYLHYRLIYLLILKARKKVCFDFFFNFEEMFIIIFGFIGIFTKC